MSATRPATVQAAELRRHFAEIVLPLWRGPGFDTGIGLPFEAVAPDTHAPLPVSRFRAMACARQLFVFAGAGELAHADALFDGLCRHFRDPRHDGWFYSVDAQGAPLDRNKDLYTHAFIVFACAGYFAASGNRDARRLAEHTAALIEDRFAPNAGEACLDAARAEDFSPLDGGPLQNPLMHLTEAWLAAGDAFGDRAFDDALLRTAGAVERVGQARLGEPLAGRADQVVPLELVARLEAVAGRAERQLRDAARGAVDEVPLDRAGG
ncbi:AGE family epimerase/isomerase, partial [Burkholderia gladioli]|nr:AGE family epimerase/isomerase [Burkholderia gladioli]